MKAILGTMFELFGSKGGVEVDTAYVYNDGACETVVGKSLASADCGKFKLATKVNPRVSGHLDYEAVMTQLDGSLDRLGLEAVDVLYFHFPDRSTSIEEPIKGAAEAYAQGKFRELGVSNFPLSLVRKMGPICDEFGCPRPSVFEGVYNALSRKAEGELFPALDELGMRFYAYNPLAGGMLTGRYTSIEEKPSKGRFALRAKSYQGRYWKSSYFEAVNLAKAACEETGISLAEAAYRWLAYHSCLSAERGDGVIVGASRVGQLEQNLEALRKGPLSVKVVSALDKAYRLTEADAPEYYRYYEKPREA